jgi:hypothetical protein
MLGYKDEATKEENAGNTKSARFFEAGNMRFIKDTNTIITEWIYEKLS